MSAMPIGMPGWPELAAWTASMARKRMALARSRRLGVVMGGKSLEAAPGDSRAPHCPTPPHGSKKPYVGVTPPTALADRSTTPVGSRGAGCGCPCCECPPASACGRRVLLYFAPSAPAPAAASSVAAEEAQRKAWFFASLRSDAPARPAALRGEIKEEASAARRMPEDIRPEGLPVAPGPIRLRRGLRSRVDHDQGPSGA